MWVLWGGIRLSQPRVSARATLERNRGSPLHTPTFFLEIFLEIFRLILEV
jgi:hypothetical protein